jgi:hypothetical protein
MADNAPVATQLAGAVRRLDSDAADKEAPEAKKQCCVKSGSSSSSSSSSSPSRWQEYFTSTRLQQSLQRIVEGLLFPPRKRLTRQAADLLSSTVLKGVANMLVASSSADDVGSQPSNVEQLKERIRRKDVLAVEGDDLPDDACAAVDKIVEAMQAHNKKATAAAGSGGGLLVTRGSEDYTAFEEGGLVLPVVPAVVSDPSRPLSVEVRLGVTSVLQFLAEDILKLSAQTTGDRYLYERHIQGGMQTYDDLEALGRHVGASDKFQRSPVTHVMASQFPKMQSLISALNKRYAWYHNPLATELVLQRYLRGELQSGDAKYWRKLHIRPVAYFGRTFAAQFRRPEHSHPERTASDDEAGSDAEDDGSDYGGGPSKMEMGHDSAAFDLVDAAGREFALTVEFRPDSGDGHFYLLHGSVVPRPSEGRMAKPLALLTSSDQWRGDCTLTPEAKEFFKHYEPHGFKEQDFAGGEWDDFWGQSVPKADKPKADASAEKIKEFELQALICAGVKLCGWGDEDSLHESSMFQHNHPPAVRAQFGLAVLRQAFDGISSVGTDGAAAAAPPLHMPDDLLRLIASYAPVELPYLPLACGPAKRKVVEAAKKAAEAAAAAAEALKDKSKKKTLSWDEKDELAKKQTIALLLAPLSPSSSYVSTPEEAAAEVDIALAILADAGKPKHGRPAAAVSSSASASASSSASAASTGAKAVVVVSEESKKLPFAEGIARVLWSLLEDESFSGDLVPRVACAHCRVPIELNGQQQWFACADGCDKTQWASCAACDANGCNKDGAQAAAAAAGAGASAEGGGEDKQRHLPSHKLKAMQPGASK